MTQASEPQNSNTSENAGVARAAAGLKLDGAPQTVFALLGDGECQEGQVWDCLLYTSPSPRDRG